MAATKKAPVLPENDELKYKQKCKDLRKRILEIEDNNTSTALSIERTKRAIKRIRLERSLLLEKIEERTLLKVDDSDGTPSPPASPVANEALKRRELSPNSQAAIAEAAAKEESPPPPVKTTSSRMKSKDPNLPKRPQNRYRIFCEEEKENIKKRMEEKHPGENYDLNRAMAAAWNELPSDERKKYNEIYDRTRAEYVRKMGEYQATSPNPDAKEIKVAKKMLKDLVDRGYDIKSPFEDSVADIPSSPPADAGAVDEEEEEEAPPPAKEQDENDLPKEEPEKDGNEKEDGEDEDDDDDNDNGEPEAADDPEAGEEKSDEELPDVENV